MVNSTNWQHVKIFSIESLTGSNKLYANGWQQTKLGVSIQVVDINNVPVPLSEDEKASLELIDYRSGKPIHFVGYEDSRNPVDTRSRSTDWSQTHDEAFRYFPLAQGLSHADAASSETSNEANTRHYVEAYVRTVSDSELRIAARITRDDGRKFESSELNEGQIRLQPVPRPFYKATDFHIRKVEIEKYNNGDSKLKFLQYNYINLRPGGIDVEIASFNMRPASLRLSEIPLPGFFESVTGFTEPGATSIKYEKQSSPLLPEQLKYPVNKGEVVIINTALAKNALKPIASIPMAGSSVVRVFDVYGNLHLVNVRLVKLELEFH